jgi:acyl dehydratase
MVQMTDINDTVLAFYGVDKLRFTKPVFIGDTIHVVKKVIAKALKAPGRGLITFDTAVLNQHGDPVLVFQDKLLVKARQ